MRKGILYAATVLLAGAGPALGQQTDSPSPSGRAARTEAPAGQPSSSAPQPANPPVATAPYTAPAATGWAPGQPGLAGCCELPVTCEPPCGPEGRCWASGEYLLWWTKDARAPALVTTSPASSGGILGQPGTQVLIGDERFAQEAFSGGRFTVGTWLNCNRTVGGEASYFFLGSRTVSLLAAGTAAPGGSAVARPFFNPLSGVEDSELVAFPGRLAGVVRGSLQSDLWGAEINALCNVCCDCDSRFDFLTGFRFLSLDERLTIREDLTVPAGLPVVGGAGFTVIDQFETRNRFYGGQVGGRWELRRGRTFLNVTGKVALGGTEQEVRIAGATSITPPGGAPAVFPGGLLALPSNIGDYNRTRFSVVPEVMVNVGYQVNDSLRLFMGYTFLYWSSVVRPGEQIDRAVNPALLPIRTAFPGAGAAPVGAVRPAATLQDTDFWVQGISFGLQLRY